MSQYIYMLMLVIVATVGGYLAYQDYQIDILKLDNQNIKTEKVIIVEESEVKEFESNQTIELYKQKGVKHEDINTSIGVHTIIFN